MPIYSPTGFLDITNATLRTSNLEAQNFKLNGGNIYVTSELTTDELLNLDNVVNAGNATSNTVQFTNVTTGLVADSNIVVTGNVTAGYLHGDASNVTAVPAAQVTGTLVVANGGTGTTTSTGTGSVVLSDAPTFTGDVTFDTDTLFVDSVNDRVGVGTTSPGQKLVVVGGPTKSDGFILGTSNNLYTPGCIYTDSNWGMLFRSAVSSPVEADFVFNDYSGSNMVVIKNGNVGIGTPADGPTKKLHVYTTASQSNSQLLLESADRYATMDMLDDSGGVQVQNDQGDLRLLTGFDASMANGSEAMRIKDNGNVGIGTTDPDAPLSIFKQTTGGFSSPQYDGGGIYLSRYSDDPTNYYGGAIYSFYTNQGAGGDSGLAFKVTDGNTTNPYGSSSPNMVIVPSGNVGIGVTDPDGTLHVKAGNRMHITSGNTPAFTGLDSAASANGRAQLVLSSAYSDLVIASSLANNNHGSTLSFTTVNPSNTAEYRKFVINQGNWGSRKDFLDFGLSASTADSNPHLSINSTDTVLTLDGNNKRVGIGKTDPQTTLDVNGTIYGSGSIVQVQHNFGNSSLSYSSSANASNGDIPLTSATGLKLSITPTKTTSKVHVNLNVLAYFNFGNGSNNGVRMQVWRKIGTTYTRVYGRGGSYHDLHWYNSVVTGNPHVFLNISFVDSPNTVSACEYELRAMFYTAPPSGGFLYIGNGGNQPATITLMEIGG